MRFAQSVRSSALRPCGGLVLAFVLAFAPVGSCAAAARAEDPPTAFEHALKAPPAEQRKRLLELAAAGDVRAAARMVDLAMWEEMKDVPVDTPPVAAWAAVPGEFGGMTGAQVLGCVEANWAARQPGVVIGSNVPRIALARTRMASAEVRSPALALELAAWWRDFEPKDDAKARALEIEALPAMEDPAADLDPLVRAARVASAATYRSRPGTAATDLGRAVELAGLAVSLSAEAGDKTAQATNLHLQGLCLQPDTNPAGDWKRAVALFERVAAIRAELGDKAGQGRALHEQATCLQPDENPAGDWTRAIRLFDRAAELATEAGDTYGQAVSLYEQARSLRPDSNPAGDWARAAALFERAAKLMADDGEKAWQALGLSEQADCLRPDLNPSGDWTRAAALYGRAAALYGEVADKESQGGSLYDQAFCLVRGDERRLTREVRALFEQSAKLSREGGDEADAIRAEEWLK